MGKNKNGKQKQKLEEVPEELEEEEEYYDYSAEEENYGLSELLDDNNNTNWTANATAGQYDPWGGNKADAWGAGKTVHQTAAGGQWGNTIPTPAQMAAQHAAASGSKGGGSGGKMGENAKGKGGEKAGKGGRKAPTSAWETWGQPADSWGKPADAWGSNTAGGGGWGSTNDASGWGPPADEKRWETAQPPKQTQGHWSSWGEEAKRLPKVTPVSSSFVGNRNDLSAQQQSEILQALLNHPNQGHDVRSVYQEQPKGGAAYYEQYKGGPPEHWPNGGKKQKQTQNNPHIQNDEQQGKKKGKKNKQAAALQQRQSDPWGVDPGGWGGEGGWGMPEEDEYRDDYNDPDRRVHFTPISANLWGGSQHDSTYKMPSKTLAHAYEGTTTSLYAGTPRNKVSESAEVQFIDSKGAALKPVHQALFGKTRMAKDRIHWMFSPNKDERVASLLAWIEIMSYSLGTYGLHRFLQSRERGALIANADYRPPQSPQEPAFDWLTFDQLQASRDKILQESVAFYDPAVTCIVFVFLPSKSGNSVAMWRRKITIGNNTRASRINEINLAMAGLRREKDYVVHVDELVGAKQPEGTKGPATPGKSASHKYDYARTNYPYETALEKKPKKQRWWACW